MIVDNLDLSINRLPLASVQLRSFRSLSSARCSQLLMPCDWLIKSAAGNMFLVASPETLRR